MGEAVVAVDSAQRVVLFNRAAEDLFGYEASAVLGQPLEILLPEATRANHGKFFSEFSRGSETRRLMGGRPEIGGQRKDGSVFRAEAALARAFSNGDSIFVAILRDITDRVRDRAMLDRSNLLLAGVSRALSRVIQNEHITDVCDEMLSVLIEATGSEYGFLGEVEHDPDGTPYLRTHAVTNIAWDDETRALYEENARSGLRFDNLDTLFGSVIRTGEVVIANDAPSDPRSGGVPPGHPDLNSFLGLPVRRGDELLGMAGIANRPGGYDEEIIALVQPILTTHASIIDLYRRNAEKAAMAEQLRQAQKMEAMGQLTGGVAHDFNNLLAIIQGHAEFLAEETGRDHPNMRPILNSARRGAELTQRLLAFGRRQPLRPDVVDLGALVAGMSGLLSRTLGETITVETDVAADLAVAAADPGQVENALLNLANNARHAMPDGGTLTITCANATLGGAITTRNPEVDPGDYVMLSVRDTGTGMEDDVLDRVFEPFFTTKGVGEGSGLGLSMVYGFAKQSGGHTTVSSRVGEGTTVNIYLPRSEQRKETDGGDVSSVRFESPDRDTDSAILLVEDDPDVRAMAMRMLTGLGYTAFEADTVAAARKILADGTPIDLVLSDVVLPGGVSGFDFGDELRRTHPELKIIYMSGYSTAASERIDADDTPLLTKPFTREELVRAMDRVLD